MRSADIKTNSGELGCCVQRVRHFHWLFENVLLTPDSVKCLAAKSFRVIVCSAAWMWRPTNWSLLEKLEASELGFSGLARFARPVGWEALEWPCAGPTAGKYIHKCIVYTVYMYVYVKMSRCAHLCQVP